MKKSFNQRIGCLSPTATHSLIVASAIALVAASQPVAGQPIYTADFEPDTFLADTTLVGQDSWVAPGILSPNAAVVTSGKPRQGRQTVHVLGADLEHSDFVAEASEGLYDAIGSYRRPVNHDTGGTQTIRISAHVRVDGPLTAAGHHFYSASIGARATSLAVSAGVGELAISSDGRAYAYTGNENVPTFLGSLPVKLGAWHELAVEADFAAETSSFYVDGVLLGTFPFDPAETYTGILLRGAMLAYAAPDTATNKKADYASSYDKFSIVVVAE